MRLDKMIEKRTDLALEQHEIHAKDGVLDGVLLESESINGFEITRVTVIDSEGERITGKPKGSYVTVDIGRVWEYGGSRFEECARTLADEIKKLIPDSTKSALIAGLGNRNITSDSIGPRAASGIIVTHHLEKFNPELCNKAGFGDVSSITPGVLGQTGIESADIIKSVTDCLKPDLVIAVDALASRRLSRLATTLQLSDTGISPGSGVQNHRHSINEQTLGVPTLSIGIPTVVDALTLALDLLEDYSPDVLPDELTREASSYFVTPKDSDVIIKEASRLISLAINIALHNVEIKDIPEYLGPG